jgi:ribosomal protein L33
MGKNDPQEYKFKGITLSCPICSGNRFWKENARVKKGLGQYLCPDREAITLTCAECRHILWFED